MLNGLTIDEAAGLLQVTSRTIAHWECGVTRIPYSAFKLLRYLASGELLPHEWQGWVIKGDTLWSPTGRPYRQHELNYLTHYFTMARYWQSDYDRRCSLKQSSKMMLFNHGLGYGGDLIAPCRPAMVARRAIKTQGLMLNPWLDGYFAPYRLVLNVFRCWLAALSVTKFAEAAACTPPCNTGGFENQTKFLSKVGISKALRVFICMCIAITLINYVCALHIRKGGYD